MLASLVGLCFNLALNLVLMDRLGAPGIALAATLAVGFATFLLLLVVYRQGHVAWIDVIMVLLDWMLYATLALTLHFASYAGVAAVLLAFLFLAIPRWRFVILPQHQPVS